MGTGFHTTPASCSFVMGPRKSKLSPIQPPIFNVRREGLPPATLGPAIWAQIYRAAAVP
jgi:hypothetical protein